ncbi:glycerophosphoryl diester phosphodiesterase membrane domain-containing protein [Kineococcus sp. SYSU DK005]|uniref:glycerophosphoryl diester phosphodiesterase membrane domain-containing protein n=1 Tax=Kineococcus sp. SYSU DK005 TaxID=3383126 RepID=UPI003D7EE6CD
MSQWQGPGDAPGGWSSPGGGAGGPGGQGGPDGPVPGAWTAGAPDPRAAWGRPGWSAPGAGGPQPGIVPLRPLGLGEIWDGAFRAFRQNPRVMVGLSALVVVATSAVTVVASVLVARDVVRTTTALEAGTGDPAELLLGLTSSGPLVLLSTLLQVVSVQLLNGVLILSVSRAVLGRTISVAELWRVSRPRLLPLLLLSVLVTLAGGVGALALVPGVLVLVLADAGAAVASGVVLLLAGLLAWVATGLWLWAKWSMAAPALLLEGLSVRRSLGRSWRLTRGSTWRVLGVLLLTSVVVLVVVAAVQTPFALLGSLVMALLDGGSVTVSVAASQAVSTLGSVLGSVVAYPFLASVTALLYVDLRVRREGLDVELHRAASGG